MDLRQYFEKNVILTDIDGIVFKGLVVNYTPAIDSEDDMEEIGLELTNIPLHCFKKGDLVAFRQDEISKIVIVSYGM